MEASANAKYPELPIWQDSFTLRMIEKITPKNLPLETSAKYNLAYDKERVA